jgi:hypothetical protein
MSASTKTLLVFAFEHGVIALKVAVALLIPDVTAEVQMHRRKQKRNMVQAQTQVMERRRMELSVKHTGFTMPLLHSLAAMNSCCFRSASLCCCFALQCATPERSGRCSFLRQAHSAHAALMRLCSIFAIVVSLLLTFCIPH